MRKEGSRLLEEEQNLLKEQIKKGNERIIIDDVAEEIKTPKLKVLVLFALMLSGKTVKSNDMFFCSKKNRL